MEARQILLKDYLYELPDDKIARYPLKERDASKLLVYRKDHDLIHTQFKDITEFLPTDSTLFFNNTKVIPARLLFRKATGATIEIFLLQPKTPSTEVATAMQVQKKASWICMVRNLKKWKHNEILSRSITLDGTTITVNVKLLDASSQHVELHWDKPVSFAEMITILGEVPLPPYLKRKAETSDKSTYQTVYSQKEGAVAAPTAGLHFTPEVLKKLEKKGILSEFLTLHVSAGTFQPIKEEEITSHPMHSEQIILSKENLLAIYGAAKTIAVGTTSMRTLESLYWFGVKLFLKASDHFFIKKLTPYQYTASRLPTKKEALEAILHYMTSHNLSTLTGETEIFIFPGYQFRVCDGLVTNFHQPGSTLILLVAAFVGEDWRNIYKEALENNYRFLSYGDSSLLLP